LESQKVQIGNYNVSESTIETFYATISSLVVSETISKLNTSIDNSKSLLKKMKNERNLTLSQVLNRVKNGQRMTTSNTKFGPCQMMQKKISNKILNQTNNHQHHHLLKFEPYQHHQELPPHSTHLQIPLQYAADQIFRNHHETDNYALKENINLLAMAKNSNALRSIPAQTQMQPQLQQQTKFMLGESIEDQDPKIDTQHHMNYTDSSQMTNNNFGNNPCNYPLESEQFTRHVTKLNNFSDLMRNYWGRKSVVCQQCNKTFTHSSALNSHMRIHTGEKPFECKVCKKAFTHAASLYNHKRLHTGEKPFECNNCHEKFTFKTSLNNHLRLVHGEITCSQVLSEHRRTINRYLLK
jgi:uncharacterized Zn-finger protein